MIDRIKRLPLRDVWKHEAYDFTTWLEDNIDVLNEVLDLNLSSVEREKSAGSFNVDLVADDGENNLVVIENQLEKSNHDHLGKLLTYFTMLDAKKAIWIVAHPRPEHVKCINWLNESSNGDFYLLKLESIQIGTSDPAPLLTVIVSPSEEAKDIGRTKKHMSERSKIRYNFWEQLLNKEKEKSKLHSGISPSPHSWIGTGAGISGLGFNFAVRQHDAQAELYINRGKGPDTQNKLIFDEFYKAKKKIEEKAGCEINWEKLETKRACRISIKSDAGGWKSPESNWPAIHDALIDAMIKLESSLRPSIKKLSKNINQVIAVAEDVED